MSLKFSSVLALPMLLALPSLLAAFRSAIRKAPPALRRLADSSLAFARCLISENGRLAAAEIVAVTCGSTVLTACFGLLIVVSCQLLTPALAGLLAVPLEMLAPAADMGVIMAQGAMLALTVSAVVAGFWIADILGWSGNALTPVGRFEKARVGALILATSVLLLALALGVCTGIFRVAATSTGSSAEHLADVFGGVVVVGIDPLTMLACFLALAGLDPFLRACVALIATLAALVLCSLGYLLEALAILLQPIENVLLFVVNIGRNAWRSVAARVTNLASDGAPSSDPVEPTASVSGQ